jgi:hypothetical protein
MKILVAPTLYITAPVHFVWADNTIKSFKESSINFDLIGFINALGEPYEKKIKRLFKKTYKNRQNNLSKSWNRAIDYGMENNYDYTIIPNLDILVQPETFENLIEFAQTSPKKSVLWSGYCTNHPQIQKPETNYLVSAYGYNNYDTYALFMVNNKLFEKVGRFDEHYQVYCEDVDMEHRLNLAGYKHWCVKDAPFYHAENITLHGIAPKDQGAHNEETNGALAYFVKKWGGPPRFPVYKTPFNKKGM